MKKRKIAYGFNLKLHILYRKREVRMPSIQEGQT